MPTETEKFLQSVKDEIAVARKNGYSAVMWGAEDHSGIDWSKRNEVKKALSLEGYEVVIMASFQDPITGTVYGNNAMAVFWDKSVKP